MSQEQRIASICYLLFIVSVVGASFTAIIGLWTEGLPRSEIYSAALFTWLILVFGSAFVLSASRFMVLIKK